SWTRCCPGSRMEASRRRPLGTCMEANFDGSVRFSSGSVISLLGVNHRTAPVALRERLAFTEESVPEVLHLLQEFASEAYVLSTCNRTELYAVSHVEDP